MIKINKKSAISPLVVRRSSIFTKVKRRSGFTLPEVIISFSVLVLVITAATQILVTVLRVNANNVNSLVAYGLAQEGIDAMRFVRDSDTVLGLQFDGSVKGKPDSVWGQKLFDSVTTPGVKFFTLEVKNADELKADCKKVGDFGAGCLPIQLKELNNIDEQSLVTDANTEDQLKTLPDVAAATLVYKKIAKVDGGNSASPAAQALGDNSASGLVYLQNKSDDQTFAPTQFHRFIRVESLKTAAEIDKLRVSSVVSWIGSNDLPMQVVLTSELTNWK